MSDKKVLPDKCAVTRDLMPLCIDGTASEASQRRVNKHVADCQPCATVYQEMQTQIDLDVPVEQESEQFDTAVKKVKHKHAWRKLRNVLLGVVLALVMCAGLAYGYYWYFVEEVPLPIDLYQLELKMRSPQSAETPVLISTTNLPKPAKIHVEVRYDGSVLNTANQLQPNWVMYIWASATRSVDLDTCGYSDSNFYAFDQKLEGENIYDAGNFLINGALYEVFSVYKGAADGEQQLLFKRNMHGYGLKWSSPTDAVLRSVASLEIIGEETPMPFVTPEATVPPTLTQEPRSFQVVKEPNATAEPIKVTATPMLTQTPLNGK